MIPLLLLLTACSPQDSGGTSVGNPGLFAMRAAAPSEEVEVVDGWAHTEVGAVHGCDETGEPFELEPVGLGDVQDVPSGDGCAFELALGGLELEVFVPGLTEDSHVVAIPVDGVIVSAPTAFSIEPDGEYVFEFGEPGWLNEGLFELDGEEIVLREDELPGLLGLIELGSGLYRDGDNDSELSVSERDAGPIAAGDPEDVPQSGDGDSDGSSTPACQSGGSLALLPGVLLLGLRRRYSFAS